CKVPRFPVVGSQLKSFQARTDVQGGLYSIGGQAVSSDVESPQRLRSFDDLLHVAFRCVIQRLGCTLLRLTRVRECVYCRTDLGTDDGLAQGVMKQRRIRHFGLCTERAVAVCPRRSQTDASE